ncbi:hypothetical protein WDW86_08700 [Bdellovibrionota bacterium FG-2]
MTPVVKSLDEKLLKRFLKLASGRLSGEWVLLGGTVLPYLGHSYRTTTDIDFVPVEAMTNDQSLKIMTICEELGLPIETVNGAAAFFLQKIPDFKNHLVLIQQGQAKIYRPSVMLFLQLKLSRLSESDFRDCLEMLKLKSAELSSSEGKTLVRLIGKLRDASADREKLLRYDQMQEALKSR